MNGQHDQLSVVQGSQKNSTLYHLNDGFWFYCYRRNDRAMYFRCSKYKKHTCPVKGIFIFGEGFYVRGLHSDAPDFGQVAFKAQRLVLLEQARRLDVASLRDIFSDLPRNLPNGITYHRMYPAMMRERMSVLPQPNNFAEFIAYLENPSYVCATSTSRFEDNIYKGSSQTQNGSHVLLFISDKCVASLRVATHLCIVHTVIRQEITVLTICALIENHVIAHGWCLLDRNTPVEYSAVFQLLRNSLNSWHFMDVICNDGEVAQTFSSIFNVSVLPSLFDFISDIKTFMARTNAEFRQNYPLLKLIRLSCSLAMLPHNLTQTGINVIRADAQNCDETVFNDAVPLFNYLEVKWLRALHNFPVFGSTVRTHFGCEELKAQLARELCGRTINYFSILRNFVATAVTSHRHMKQLINGHKIYRVTTSPMMAERELQVLMMNLVRPPCSLDIAVWNYLQVVAQKLQHIL